MRSIKNLKTLIAIFLSLIIFQTGIEAEAFTNIYEDQLQILIKQFNNKNYNLVISESEKLLNEISDEYSQIRGKFFLLLGATYEKLKDKNNAVENYLLGDMLLDDLAVEGMDFSKLEIFRSTLYGKVINGKRVYEKVGKRKKRKKFPFLVVVGVIGVIIAAAILMKKNSGNDVPDIKSKYAKEVFDSIEWIDVPAGEFRMGDGHNMGSRDELPVHKVYLDSYKISKYEITRKTFDRFLSSHPEIVLDISVSQKNSEPVGNVKRELVLQFTNWLSQYTGNKVGLPTEAQWEKAARGTDQRIYPWGNNSPNCTILRYNWCEPWPALVGSYPQDKSFYGVMDMGGNVSEMCKDIYQDNYYKFSPYSNPQGPDPGTSNKYVIRGASISFGSKDPRASNRAYMNSNDRSYDYGFRIVWND